MNHTAHTMADTVEAANARRATEEAAAHQTAARFRKSTVREDKSRRRFVVRWTDQNNQRQFASFNF